MNVKQAHGSPAGTVISILPSIVFVSDSVLLRQSWPTVKAGALFSTVSFPWDFSLGNCNALGGGIPLF